MKPTRLVTALAVTAALTLAGCSDDPDPKLAPSTDQSTSSPAEPSDSPSPTPEALDPEQTVRAWIDARNAAADAPADSTRSSSSALLDCDSLSRHSIDPIRRSTRTGGFETYGWRVDEQSRRSRSARSSAVVTRGVIIPGGRTTPAQARSPIAYDEERAHRDDTPCRTIDSTGMVTFVGYIS